ncbi:MAG: hypothetical protein H8E11_09420 [Candidatus Cloacimonetes bacterium]|nr:hypothetical protein [Candidatus Cloacimonadota bacterium]
MNKEINKVTKRHQLPWYSISLLLTILGAVSIILLFGVYFYNEQGIVFWSIIVAWIAILLGAAMEIGRQEKLRRKMESEKEQLIIELSQALAKNKKEKETK